MNTSKIKITYQEIYNLFFKKCNLATLKINIYNSILGTFTITSFEIIYNRVEKINWS